MVPKEMVQVILGTNGCGKSSLIRLIAPGAVDGSLFKSTGFLNREYLFNNKIYKLNYNAKTNKHSFQEEQKDGSFKELNESGGINVQNSLIQDRFKITPFIRSLITGEIRFSELGPQKRRDLFTAMSPTPFDYGLEFYARAQKSANEVSALLKRTKKQLVDEIAKVMNEEQYKTLQQENKDLHYELSLLYEQRAPIKKPSEALRRDQANLLSEISELSNRLIAIDLTPPEGIQIKSIDNLNDLIVKEREKLSALESIFQDRVKLFEEINNKVAVVKGSQDIEQIKEKIEQMENEVRGLQSSLSTQYQESDYEAIFLGLDPVSFDHLEYIFNNLPLNDEMRFSNAEFRKTKEEHETVMSQIYEFNREKEQLTIQIQELDKHKENSAATCPECKHSWIIGFDPHQYKQKVSRLTSITEQIQKLEEKRKEIEKNLTELKDFFDKYKEYISIRNNNPKLNILWSDLEKDHTAFKYPKEALHILQRFQSDSSKIRRIIDIRSNIEKEKVLLGLVEKVDKEKFKEQSEALVRIEKEISNLTFSIRDKKDYIRSLLEFNQKLVECFDKLGRRISELKNHSTALHEQTIETIRQECIHDLIKTLQSKLAINEEVLNGVEHQKGFVEHLQGQIVKYELEEIAVKRIIDEISPNTGLIAEGLMSYINSVLEKVNLIIEKVWTYSFKILPCTVNTEGEVGLTYRFPIDIADGLNTIKDISIGSKAQKEITDLAFRIVAMNYLGFSEMMLFLDEFGDGFDPTHKAAAVHAINTIIEQMNFSQIFLVSHSETTYGALKNNEVCLLSDLNVRVTTPFNTHVIMK